LLLLVYFYVLFFFVRIKILREIKNLQYKKENQDATLRNASLRFFSFVSRPSPLFLPFFLYLTSLRSFG